MIPRKYRRGTVRPPSPPRHVGRKPTKTGGDPPPAPTARGCRRGCLLFFLIALAVFVLAVLAGRNR